MLIGKFENAYGDEFWATGEDVDGVIRELWANSDETVTCETVEWFRGVPVRVTGKTTYTIENM